MSRGRVGQDLVEVVEGGGYGVRITEDVVEVVETYTAPSPTTITGGGISQDVVEVVMLGATTPGLVSQDVVEVVLREGNVATPTTTGTRGTASVA